MRYKTTCAILWKGDRVVAGTELEMSEADAANLGGNVVAVGESAAASKPAEETAPETALEDMTKEQLVAEAKKRELPTTGTKADLIDRIKLFDAGPEAPAEEGEEELAE